MWPDSLGGETPRPQSRFNPRVRVTLGGPTISSGLGCSLKIFEGMKKEKKKKEEKKEEEEENEEEEEEEEEG
jgi:hypothetical protein